MKLEILLNNNIKNKDAHILLNNRCNNNHNNRKNIK